MATSKHQNIRKGLSQAESFLLASLAQAGQSLFTLSQVASLLHCSPEQAKHVIYRLKKKRWIETLQRGCYLLLPLEAGVEPVYTEQALLIASCLTTHPYYISYLSAAHFHGLTDQTPMTVFMATPKHLTPRQIHGVHYQFVWVQKHKFFGYAPVKLNAQPVNLADREKTLVDGLDLLQYAGGIAEVASMFYAAQQNHLDYDKLFRYALRMGNGAILKRWGYLAEVLPLPVAPKLLQRLQASLTPGFAWLDPTAPRHGRYVTRWQVIANVTENDLRRGLT